MSYTLRIIHLRPITGSSLFTKIVTFHDGKTKAGAFAKGRAKINRHMMGEVFKETEEAENFGTWCVTEPEEISNAKQFLERNI